MDDIDKLLAQVKAEQAEKPERLDQPREPLQPKPAPSADPVSPVTQGFDSVDRLLSQVKAEAQTPPASRPPLQPPLGSVVSGAKETLARSPDFSLLAQVKAQYEEQDRQAALQQQEALEAERRRQEQLQEEQRAALVEKAQAWLEHLDPLSGEGLWFEEFAQRYPSRIEAALDYLYTSLD